MFTPDAFPHIAEAIVAHSGQRERNTLRLVCKFLCDKVDEFLAYHIEVVGNYDEATLHERGVLMYPNEIRSHSNGRFAAFSPSASGPSGRQTALHTLLARVRVVDLDGPIDSNYLSRLVPYLTNVETVRLCWNSQQPPYVERPNFICPCPIAAEEVVSFVPPDCLADFTPAAANGVKRIAIKLSPAYACVSVTDTSHLTNLAEVILHGMRLLLYPGLQPPFDRPSPTWRVDTLLNTICQHIFKVKCTVLFDEIVVLKQSGRFDYDDIPHAINTLKMWVVPRIRHQHPEMSRQDVEALVNRRLNILTTKQYHAQVGDETFYRHCQL